ncbi:MAG: hypothetical protein ACRD3L_04490 [Terriglobales bacterium]
MIFNGAAGVAQRTTVENNGAGRIETDYNATNKVTEMRTVGADGKLQQKVEYEYLPGYYGAQQTDTTYWPNSVVRKVSHHTYDESSNFTGEFIENFDDSGKQIAGHKLAHDPRTGVYRCWEWSGPSQGYKSVACPAGEEEGGGGGEKIEKFTFEEVMQHLDAARKTARQDDRIGHAPVAAPAQPPFSTTSLEVGLVFPAQVRPGERISGSVVENPDQYEGLPEVVVTRVKVPLPSEGEGSRLSEWLVEAPDEGPQRADGPITLVVPRHNSDLRISLRHAGNPACSVSTALSLPVYTAKNPRPPISFRAPALCMKGDICLVSGLFNGNSGKTFAAFEDRPATILAETSDAAYIRIPELTLPGPRPLFIMEGRKVAAFPLVVGELVIKNNQRELGPGQMLIMSATLDGPGDLPDALWRLDNFPVTGMERARQLIPGFQLAGDNRENRENDQAETKVGIAGENKEKGEIMVIIKNANPSQISLRGSKNELLVFHLSDEAFSRGEFKYELLVEAKTKGKVDVKGYAIPFLAPAVAQEFTLKIAGAR